MAAAAATTSATEAEWELVLDAAADLGEGPSWQADRQVPSTLPICGHVSPQGKINTIIYSDYCGLILTRD